MASKKFRKNRAGVTSAEPVKVAEEVVRVLEKVSPKVLDWQRVERLESDAEYETACKVLVELKAQINKADEERHAIVDPLNGVVKHVNRKVREFTEPREKLEVHIKFLLKMRLEEQRALAMKAAEKEAKRAESKGADQLAEDIRAMARTSQPVPENNSVNFRSKWTFKVVNEKKVPREYLCVDEAKLKKMAGPGAPQVDGVEFYEDTVVAVSA